MKRHSVFCKTEEDWCGSFKIERDVRVSLLLQVTFHGDIDGSKTEPCFRVSVWGNDDFGLEKDFTSKAEAYKMFLKILKIPSLTREALEALGLVAA